MKAFVFQAALHCSDCANRLRDKLTMQCNATGESLRPLSEDSDVWPQLAAGRGGGEADSPQHCDTCGVFLENPLTPEGDDSLRVAASEFDGKDLAWCEIAELADSACNSALAEHIRYYFSWGS